jgi:nicotinate dehydrogenase subunit A
LNALQRAFIEEQAVQCGYCIPGIIISAQELLTRVRNPDEAEIRAALDRNLCRCGTHTRILRAIARAAKEST